MIEINNIGSVVRGSIWDCNEKRLLKRLKCYDPGLALKWNTQGNGNWEIHWRAQEFKPRLAATLNGLPLYKWEKIPLDIRTKINFPVPALSDDLIYQIFIRDPRRIQQHGETEAQAMERHWTGIENRLEDDHEDKKDTERKYRIKHERKAIKEYYELIRSGYNPLFPFFIK